MDRLREEFEALGLYLSAHPLDDYVDRLDRLKVITATELAAMIDSRNIRPRVNLAGSVTAKQGRISQRGNKFAFVQFTDQTGVFEITFFSDILWSFEHTTMVELMLVVCPSDVDPHPGNLCLHHVPSQSLSPEQVLCPLSEPGLEPELCPDVTGVGDHVMHLIWVVANVDSPPPV